MGKAVRNRKIERMMPDGEAKQKSGAGKVVLFLAIAAVAAVGTVFACNMLIEMRERGKREAEAGKRLERCAKVEVARREEAKRVAKMEKERQERMKTSKLVALTFDDGPERATTGRLLDILRAKGVKATFFVLGYMVERAPDLLRREVAEGHEVGSHTTRHINLNRVEAPEEVQAEMGAMRQIMAGITGQEPVLMRPPFGNGIRRPVVTENVGMPMIHWSVDPEDWKVRDAGVVRGNVLNTVYDGAIVLMHDVYDSTVDAVAYLIDDLRAAGYELVTVPELAALRGVDLVPGQVYFYFKP